MVGVGCSSQIGRFKVLDTNVGLERSDRSVGYGKQCSLSWVFVEHL